MAGKTRHLKEKDGRFYARIAVPAALREPDGWDKGLRIKRGRPPQLSNGSLHGLRKACARRLAKWRCRHHEIKAITGHKTDEDVRRCTAKADQVPLAHRALEKLQAIAKNPKSANRL